MGDYFLVLEQVGSVSPNTAIWHTMVSETAKKGYQVPNTAIKLNTVKQQCQRNLPVSTFNKEVEKYLHYTQFPFAVACWLTNGAGGRGSLFVCKCQGAGARMAKPQSNAA